MALVGFILAPLSAAAFILAITFTLLRAHRQLLQLNESDNGMMCKAFDHIRANIVLF